MPYIDYEQYPILKEPDASVGAPTEKERTPFGLLFVALSNHLAAKSGEKTRYPSKTKLAFALFALLNESTLLSRVGLYGSDLEPAQRKTTYRYYISKFATACNIAARRCYNNDNVDPNPIPLFIKRDDVSSLYAALSYTLRTEHKGWQPIGRNPINLLDLLQSHPITGEDDFSIAMDYVYGEAFGRLTPHMTDLLKCVEKARQTKLNTPEPNEELKLNASLEALKVITMGILYGPKGLDLYATKTKTPEVLSGVYKQECIGFALTQLWQYTIEENVEGHEGDVKCFSKNNKNAVELRRMPSNAECFCPTTTKGEQCAYVSDPHACIELIDKDDYQNGFTPRWCIRERENGTTNGTAIRRACDGIARLLGEQEYELEDGDEILLAPIMEGEDIVPNYEKGAVIRFQKVFDYQYTETDDTTFQTVEASVSENIPKKDAQLMPTGFSLCPLNKETHDFQEALRRSYPFADLMDETGNNEFKIGRDQAIANYSYGLGDEHISKEHASITLAPGGTGVTLREGTTTNKKRTNGMEIVREGRIIPIGGKAPLKECLLKDGDKICFTSTRACFAILSFSYKYD